MPAIKTVFLFLFVLLFLQQKQSLIAQPASVTKTYSKPVFMHYMPWFDTPEYNGSWGWHWTMNNQNPDSIIDQSTGKRQIASHYYPLIGPYDVQDPNVIEYHLLLMKYAGIDGILIDWYGVQGSNGDINKLLENSNALIEKVGDVGLTFALIVEDNFTDTLPNAQANFAYARDSYFVDPSYYRYGDSSDPLVGVFGPITFETESDWDSILPYAGEDIEFLQLMYQGGEVGTHSDGEYAWVYEDEAKDDHLTRFNNFYKNRAKNLKTAMAGAYPGFEDFYQEGNAGSGFFEIPHDSGKTLDSCLQLLVEHDSVIDLLQLSTWNDFGEGTMFEPCRETGFSYLQQMQQFLGVGLSDSSFAEIHRLYLLREEYDTVPKVQASLDNVFGALVSLDLDKGIAIMDTLQGLIDTVVIVDTNQTDTNVVDTNQIDTVTSIMDLNSTAGFNIYPNPNRGSFYLDGPSIGKEMLKIYSSLGKEIAFTAIENHIQLLNISKGIYWVERTVSGKRIVKKIIIH